VAAEMARIAPGPDVTAEGLALTVVPSNLIGKPDL
jgi:hypothetical protein